MSGVTKDHAALSISVDEYLNIVNELVLDCIAAKSNDKKSRLLEKIATLKKRQRAFGSMTELSIWRSERGWKVPGNPMPAIQEHRITLLNRA
ncbi:MAG: hypothetical protein ACI9P7_000920 [Candidatus Azotimanducaceae bacterium]